MTTRELFEAEFPVPEGVAWKVTHYSVTNRNFPEYEICREYNAKWIGFQAGWEASGGVE